MTNARKMALRLVACAGLAVGIAAAQTAVVLDDTSQTTTLNANVAEQAQVTVPASVAFTVNDISVDTDSAAASVTIDNIVLATATKQLVVSLQAEAAAFTPPVGGATTWSAGDVTWNAATWTTGTGATGTLSESAYNTVVTCGADAASCSTSTLEFTLGAKTTVQRSGTHALDVRWKFESTGT